VPKGYTWPGGQLPCAAAGVETKFATPRHNGRTISDSNYATKKGYLAPALAIAGFDEDE
jgi:hypothetical protein